MENLLKFEKRGMTGKVARRPQSMTSRLLKPVTGFGFSGCETANTPGMDRIQSPYWQ